MPDPKAVTPKERAADPEDVASTDHLKKAKPAALKKSTIANMRDYPDLDDEDEKIDLPAKKPKYPSKNTPNKSVPPPPPNKAAGLAKKAGFGSTAEYNDVRRQGLGDSLWPANVNSIVETKKVSVTRVDILNENKFMNDLATAIKIVEDLEQDELDDAGSVGMPAEGGGEPAGGAPLPDDGMGGDGLESSEPPVSDSAVGADTEGATALGLLRDMANSLQQLAAALAPPTEEEGAGDMEGAPGGPEGEGAIPPGAEAADGAAGADEAGVPPVGDDDEEGESAPPDEEGGGEEGGEGEEGEEEESDDEEAKAPNRRPAAKK